ncbi:MAG: recombinase family protein, partial [Cyanobacteria bacterium REEB65]|nr:recombinase family protein [Cyanobacteria bacterium REEB65]
RALIRSRIKNALAIKKARGERLGMVPYGMRATSEGLLEPDETEQAALRRIFELHAQGMGAPRIARALEEEGIPARGDRWHVTSVTRILQGKSGQRVDETPTA